MCVSGTYTHKCVFGFTRTRSHSSKMSVSWQRSLVGLLCYLLRRYIVLPPHSIACGSHRRNSHPMLCVPYPLPLFAEYRITCSVAFVFYCELICRSRSRKQVRTSVYPAMLSSVKKKMPFTFSAYSLFLHRFCIHFETSPIKGLPDNVRKQHKYHITAPQRNPSKSRLSNLRFSVLPPIQLIRLLLSSICETKEK